MDFSNIWESAGEWLIHIVTCVVSMVTEGIK